MTRVYYSYGHWRSMRFLFVQHRLLPTNNVSIKNIKDEGCNIIVNRLSAAWCRTILNAINIVSNLKSHFNKSQNGEMKIISFSYLSYSIIFHLCQRSSVTRKSRINIISDPLFYRSSNQFDQKYNFWWNQRINVKIIRNDVLSLISIF